jgi:nucleoside 2-deoxyribosyltransferase
MSENGRFKIYCSGPLFCAEEVGGMQAIADTFEQAGMRTFLPHRDGLEPWVMRFANTPGQEIVPGLRRRIDQAIFDLDVFELVEACDAVVFNMNGRVPDEGGVVEAAIAFAAGKPVMLFKCDLRAPFGGHDNAMLLGLTGGKLITERESLPQVARQLIGRYTAPRVFSAALAGSIASGRKISALLDKLPKRFGKQSWDDKVIEQVLAQIEVDGRE